MRIWSLIGLLATLGLLVLLFCCSRGNDTQTAAQVSGNVASQQSAVQGKVVELEVSGMTCTGCEAAVESALTRIDGVKKADADYQAGKATVVIDSTRVKEEQLIEALDNAGYPATRKSSS